MKILILICNSFVIFDNIYKLLEKYEYFKNLRVSRNYTNYNNHLNNVLQRIFLSVHTVSGLSGAPVEPCAKKLQLPPRAIDSYGRVRHLVILYFAMKFCCCCCFCCWQLVDTSLARKLIKERLTDVPTRQSRDHQVAH